MAPTPHQPPAPLALQQAGYPALVFTTMSNRGLGSSAFDICRRHLELQL